MRDAGCGVRGGVERTRESLEHARVPVGAQALEEKLALRRLAGAVEPFDSDEGAAGWRRGAGEGGEGGHGRMELGRCVGNTRGVGVLNPAH